MTAGIMVASETDQGALELLSKGREIAKELDVDLSALVLGRRADDIIRQYFEHGADRVLLLPTNSPNTIDAETFTHAIFEVSKDNAPDIILLRSTRLGKEVAGRVAEKLQAGCVTDAIGLTTKGQELVVDRYALGGNTISSEMVRTKKKIISIMPGTFEIRRAPVDGKVETLEIKIPSSRVQLMERRKKTGELVNIQSAETLVCIGKGIANKEDLAVVNELCTVLKAELGCTRALSSDYHWISEDRMVGISGKRCQPKLHVSIGISGQIQHTVGILSSELIVAINKDKEAPIFKIADYGIVGDLYEVIPKLIQSIKTLDK